MKCLLMLSVSAILFTFQAHADAFKCKDEKGKITYQGSPCSSTATTTGRVGSVPDASYADQIAARNRVNNETERFRKKDEAEEAERREWEANERRIAKEQKTAALEKRKMELLEKQAKAAEQAAANAEKNHHPKVITSCDAGGCWGTEGDRYTKGAGNTFIPTSGGFCQNIGGMMHCH